MKFPTCEVNGCEGYPEHSIGIGSVAAGVCPKHRQVARKAAREYGIKILEAVADLHDEFMETVRNVKEEKQCPTNTPK